MEIDVPKISYANLQVNESANELTSLFASFYFIKEHNQKAEEEIIDVLHHLHRIVGLFVEGQGQKLVQAPVFDGWTCSQLGEFQFFFINIHRVLLINEDTMVVQVGISTRNEPRNGWKELRHFLHDMLKPWTDIVKTKVGNKSNIIFAGYTVCYKANVVPTDLAVHALDTDILAQIKPLFHDVQVQQLAWQQLTGGSLFLLGTPRRPGMESCTIYLALVESGTNNQFVYDKIFLNNGNLLTLDAFVHKATYQFLQLGNATFSEYNLQLSQLSSEIEQVLVQIETASARNTLENEIKSIAQIVRKVLITYSRYKRMKLSVQIQKQNLQFKYLGNDPTVLSGHLIYKYYHEQMGNQFTAILLSLEKSEIILEQAKTTIALIEAQQNKISNEQSSSTQTILTVLGTGLAFLSIFDDDAAIGLLQMTGWAAKSATKDSIGWLHILEVKVLVGLAVTVVISTVIGLYHRIRN